jgi:hypothetical protein
MTAGALNEKREKVKGILSKMTSLAENRLMKPHLKKFYS